MPDNRPPAHKRGYDNRWRKFRNWYIRRHPLCEDCLKHGITTPAKIVDHIKPLNQGGAHCSVSNSQSLCMACHNRKTAKDGSK